MDGRTPPGVPNFFNPDQWLLDPFALAVAGQPRWGDASGLTPGENIRNGPRFPKGVIIKDTFDWSEDPIAHPAQRQRNL
jgi:pullulanase/glycogen debranching enzyme